MENLPIKTRDGQPMKRYFSFLVLALIVAGGCNTEPDPIRYGFDVCTFCHMTIVDQQHAAQYLTVKGRTYKFDAIECMIREIKTIEKGTIARYLVADYPRPGTMTDATSATFAISPEIQSPMGAFLTGFSEQDSATLILRGKSAQFYNWTEIQNHFAKMNGMTHQR